MIKENGFLSEQARVLAHEKIESTEIYIGWIGSTDDHIVLDKWYDDLQFTKFDSLYSMNKKINSLDAPTKDIKDEYPIYYAQAYSYLHLNSIRKPNFYLKIMLGYRNFARIYIWHRIANQLWKLGIFTRT